MTLALTLATTSAEENREDEQCHETQDYCNQVVCHDISKSNQTNIGRKTYNFG